ncbi:MAG: UxaA family hydrolase [bacterium]|nr:UxaA family hydrolase [bacterium]
MTADTWEGFARPDGRKGIRNYLLVVYLVECAHHVAREIAWPFRDSGVHLIGFGGCYPNDYAQTMLERLATHPNTGAVLLVSLGCECLDRHTLCAAIEASRRPVQTLVIQSSGGTRTSIDKGRSLVESMLGQLGETPRAPMTLPDLVVGTICGGSDATSGITANPAMGRTFDALVRAGATAIFEEPGELLGCDAVMADRAVDPEVAQSIRQTMAKTERYYEAMGHSSFASGNADGGLTTIEEKSMGSYAKTGSVGITGVIKPGVLAPGPGLYLLDVVPDGEPRYGYPNINDTAEIAELAACGSHLILFSTGRGSVVGSAVTPVIKVCANPETYRGMEGDMDINAGRILDGDGDLDEVGREIGERIVSVAAGEPTRSEALGHQEFVLTYKSFEPAGPACFPA